MKLTRWQIVMAVLLILLSAGLYYVHFLIFHDPHHIFIYMLGDLAFLPIEVLLVTLILHELLDLREKRARLDKLKMVIGVFFSGLGTELISLFSASDPNIGQIKRDLVLEADWTDKDFQIVSKKLHHYKYHINSQDLDLRRLKDILVGKVDFLLRLLENPNLQEHEKFTNLLIATLHLHEELAARVELSNLPESDLKHLDNDVRRVYIFLVHQWLEYMQHLQGSYPHLFSLALRTNPFNENASPIITA